VELDIRFDGPLAGTKNTARSAKSLTGALKKAGFDAASASPRFMLSIALGGTTGAPALTGRAELYDRQRGTVVLRKTLPVGSLSGADLRGFVRTLADAVFTAE
jgi:hypothetical protein